MGFILTCYVKNLKMIMLCYVVFCQSVIVGSKKKLCVFPVVLLFCVVLSVVTFFDWRKDVGIGMINAS